MLVDGYKGAFVPETFEHSDELSNESHRDVQMHGTLHHAISAKIGNPRMEKATSLASSTSYALSYLLAAIRPFSFSLADKAAEFQATERVRVAEEEAKRKEEEEKLAAEAAVIEEARIAAELAANPPKKKKK